MFSEKSTEIDLHDKPGTALASIIPNWAVDVKKGCACRDMAKKMDRWGVKGCIAHYDAIVDHLLTKGSDALIPMLSVAPAALKKAGAKRLLNKAIKLASENV